MNSQKKINKDNPQRITCQIIIEKASNGYIAKYNNRTPHVFTELNQMIEWFADIFIDGDLNGKLES